MLKKSILMLTGGLIFVALSVQAGDASSGKAKSEGCAQCHGDTGKDDPPIAGMAEENFIKAMKDYQSGERKNKKMQKAVAVLTDAEIADLAAYYASLK